MNDSFFKHPAALVESSRIGAGTRIWAFAHVLPGAVIGADCNVCDHVFIENDVVVGNRVTIKCGVQLWDGVTLEDDVFIGPNATFTNDRFPRSRVFPESFVKTHVAKGASVGANATILPGLTIGPGAMVAAGAVVTRDVPRDAIVRGNPARITGYTNTQRWSATDAAASTPSGADTLFGPSNGAASLSLSAVPEARLIRFPKVVDLRGTLTFGEVEAQLPFVPKRFFTVFAVSSREIRGEHAHHTLHELLLCLSGSLSVMVDNGRQRDEVLLDTPTIGLHVPPRLWRVHYKYSPDAILLSLCSHAYDANDYIRDYDDFVALVAPGASRSVVAP